MADHGARGSDDRDVEEPGGPERPSGGEGAPAARPLRAGDWLDGPGGASLVDQPWPGHRLGLPRAGRGAVAGFGRRVVQLLVDLALSGLVGSAVFLLGAERTPVATNVAGTVAFVLQVTVLTALCGQSMGMLLTGLRLQRVDGGGPVAPVAALVRALLLVLVVPALVLDADRRGLHDRAAGGVVVRV